MLRPCTSLLIRHPAPTLPAGRASSLDLDLSLATQFSWRRRRTTIARSQAKGVD